MREFLYMTFIEPFKDFSVLSYFIGLLHWGFSLMVLIMVLIGINFLIR